MARRMGGDAPSRLPRITARYRAEIHRGLAALCWLALSGAALAAGGEHADPAKEAAMRALAARDAPKEVSAQDFVAREPAKTGYCANIADAAADARFAWQKEQLAAMERQVEERIKLLEEKRAEYEVWLKRRNEFLAKADESVVAVYAKMRPDAAALQLANMPDEAAAALLTKLNARTASAILSEMEAARAANLARAMSESGRKDAAAPAQKKNQRS
ncbi:MgtE intracellular region [Methylorubrum populi]|uniref:MgtE intracellular region n=2 Tax=Methylorubrum populi TaxID=223967 RepID=A0A160P9F3_9HYPH|nr:MgtE intracellular region [Methylorubrum populi]